MITNKKFTMHKRIVLLCTMSLFYAQFLFAQNATIKESVQEFKTYPFFDPNPVANIGQIYPYFKFDGYSKTGQPKKWKVVTLENSYIKVFVLPEIGGKIWGALDKGTNKMFIYYNHVVKFRNIAMRGPWTSGGIEINFGTIGHAPTCSTPVDYITKNNDDGSVSCIIGSMDLPSRTVWNVEIRLQKDKAYFETNLLWHNSTGLSQSYYHWLNGAAHAADDLQFYFPGHNYISHGGVPHPWVIDEEGHNISIYKENNFGPYKSYHVLGEYSDFFAGYYHKDKFGFGHWSNYADKPGKKIWIWGLSRQGMIWEDLLTDTDGQYVEIQTGRLFNQAATSSTETPFKHREFLPYSTDKWKEIWFPVKETEGIKAASPYGVLNVESNSDQLKIFLNPLQKINDTLTIKVDSKIIYKKHLTINPLNLFVDSLKIKTNGKIQIRLGIDKLIYSSSDSLNNYLHRSLKAPSNFDWNSLQGLSIKAKEEAKGRRYKTAKYNYFQCLDKDPNYIPALIGIAELYFRSMNYDSALTYAKRALSIDTYDGTANFIYGLINRGKNLRADAKDGFSIAAQSVEYRSAAFTQLAEMYIEEHRWEQASNFANRAIDYNKYNLSAYKALAVSLRKQNKIAEAKAAIQYLLKIVPLNHFAMFEKYLLENEPTLLKDFKQLIRGEFPSETFLELAITYYHLGLTEEALTVLKNSPSNPIIYYWEAYLLNQLGEKEKSKSLIKKAEAQSPYLVFPFRYETANVFQWVLKESNNWKNKYYLALIYWNKGKIEKARELLTECKNEPDYPPFYLTRGKFFENIDNSYSLKEYKHAVKLDNTDWRAWLMLANLYEKMGDYQNSLKSAETIYKQRPNDYITSVPYAKALFKIGNYSKSISVLDKTVVLPNEGMGEVRTYYNNAHIMLAIQKINQNKLQEAIIYLNKAKLWPERLGSGKSYEPDEIVSDYLEWYIWNRLGAKEKASEMLLKLDHQINKGAKRSRRNTLLTTLILRKEGKNKESLKLVQDWIDKSDNNDLAKRTMALLKGDNKQAKKIILEKIKDIPEYRMFFSEPIKSLL